MWRPQICAALSPLSTDRKHIPVALSLTFVHIIDMSTRLKKMVSLALDPDLLDRLDKWRIAQDVPPAKTAVHEAALREFLERREQPKGKR